MNPISFCSKVAILHLNGTDVGLFDFNGESIMSNLDLYQFYDFVFMTIDHPNKKSIIWILAS